MDDPFFAYRPLMDEVANKLQAGRMPPRQLMGTLIAEATQRGLAPDDRTFLMDLFDALLGQKFYETGAAYLVHPLRVAGAWMRDGDQADRKRLALGLCHNLREAAVGESDLIERDFLDGDARAALGLLTIDRSRERDPAYLTAYYDGIAAAGFMVLKAHDKLDNVLGYVVEDHDAYHYELILDHVCSRLPADASQLAACLRDAVSFVREPAVRHRFTNWVPAA